MTIDLSNHLKKQKIRVFLLDGNITVIGKELENREFEILLSSAFTLEPVLTQHGIQKHLTPLVPLSFDSETILYKSKIITESGCSLKLKSVYEKQLIELMIKEQPQEDTFEHIKNRYSLKPEDA